jgi:hypothetical protein
MFRLACELQMDATRAVARRLAAAGVVEVTQKGLVIDPSSAFRGPIRLRLTSKAQGAALDVAGRL